MAGEARPASPADLVAGPVWARAAEDLARLRALTRKRRAVLHSELRGGSMGAALPDGARIRIRSGPEDTWQIGQVIAFLAGTRIMAHRIVYAGQRGTARQFLLTQGDGNWICDPPVNRSTIVGEVEAFSVDGEWRPVAPPDIGFLRRAAAAPSRAMMRALLERNPALAIAVSRPISWMRMGPRLLALKLRRRWGGDVRP